MFISCSTRYSAITIYSMAQYWLLVMILICSNVFSDTGQQQVNETSLLSNIHPVAKLSSVSLSSSLDEKVKTHLKISRVSNRRSLSKPIIASSHPTLEKVVVLDASTNNITSGRFDIYPCITRVDIFHLIKYQEH